MLTGIFRSCTTCLVGMIFCVLAALVYFHVDYPRDVDTARQTRDLKYGVASLIHVSRRRNPTTKPFISTLQKASVFQERKLVSELGTYSHDAESLAGAVSSLFVATGSVLQSLSRNTALAISESSIHSGVIKFSAWLSYAPELPLPHASAPPPNHSPVSVAQRPLSSALLRRLSGVVSPPVASPIPPTATPSHVPLPVHAPNSSVNSSDAPTGSPLSSSRGCCAVNMMIRPGLPSDSCECVYPIRLELVVDDVFTDFANWSSEFVQELASHLGIEVIQIEINSFQFHGPNLSLVIMIGPLINNSFTPHQAEKIKTILDNSKLNLNSSLFGNYTLLQFRYFEPPIPPRFSPLPLLQELPQQAHIYRRIGNFLDLKLITAVAAGAVIVIAVLVMILWRYHQPRQTGNHNVKEAEVEVPPNICYASSHETGSLPQSGTTRLFTFDELKQATNNFAPASVLGEGGIGRVHKGLLKDGTPVAIKRIAGESSRGDHEFSVEVAMLSRLHHRNLVKLLGYYASRDSSHHLLCYELIPNGSLEAWLHGPVGADKPLNWEIRIKIALDAARGLAYLHEDSQPCVIHRDFKASNILLENDFHAKVSDFGLAKQAPKGHLNYVSTRVMGTFGYVAPEYAMTGHLLVKSDVYSYGVVLLELLSGRKPVDMTQPVGQENLVAWARPILRDMERLGELADPRLLGKYPMEDFIQVAFIAAACVAPEAVQRPTMGEVVQSLKMVQRSSECATSGERNNLLTHDINKSLSTDFQNSPRISVVFGSDGSSPVFSSGQFSGLSKFESELFATTGTFSEDLQEGR